MSAEDEHFPEPCAVGGHGRVWCATCLQEWPCPSDALARVLALVEQLDADLAAAAPAHFSNGLMRGRLKTIREAVSGR